LRLFKRKTGILSAEPEKIHELSCPNCGANAKFTNAGKCKSCGTIIVSTDMQWAVISKVSSYKIFKTNNLAYYEEESGTDLPLIINPTKRL